MRVLPGISQIHTFLKVHGAELRLFSHQHLPDRPQVLEILRREVSVCIIIGLTARRGGERKGKEEVESEYVCGGRADPVPRESLEKK